MFQSDSPNNSDALDCCFPLVKVMVCFIPPDGNAESAASVGIRTG